MKAGFYDAHQMMADVHEDLYAEKKLTYGPVPGRQIEALGRTEGSCRFCVNDRWQFPPGCSKPPGLAVQARRGRDLFPTHTAMDGAGKD